MNSTVKLLLLGLLLPLSACVTQQYVDENDSPVVQNDATNNEIAMTRISLGIGYLNIGNTKQAKFNLEKAKRFAPNLVQVHTAFAHYYETVGEPELASASFEKALSLQDDDPDTLNNYGVFLCRQGNLAKAQEQFLKAIAVPSYILVSETYENLALCHLNEENFAQAQEYLEKAIEHSPTRASSLLQMATLLYAKGEYQEAKVFIKRYEKSTRRFSSQGLALSYKVYEKLRDIQTAKNYAAMLLKMFPHTYEAKQYLLNGLVEIEADKLANAYRMQNMAKKKKRVVVLKPKASLPTPVEQPKQQLNNVVNSEHTNEQSANVQSTNDERIHEQSPAKSTTEAVVSDTSVEDSVKTTAEVVNKSAEMINTDVANAPDVSDADNTTQSANTDSESTNTPIAAPTNNSTVAAFLAKSTENAKKVIAEQQNSINLPVHVVKKGDSLFSISKHYNIHMKALAKWNNLSKSKMIKIGDVIYLANPKKVVSQ